MEEIGGLVGFFVALITFINIWRIANSNSRIEQAQKDFLLLFKRLHPEFLTKDDLWQLGKGKTTQSVRNQLGSFPVPGARKS